MAIAYDPGDRHTNADPFPIFQRLQDEDPVHWNDGLGGWVLTRYDDVKAALLDAALSADRLTPFFDHVESQAGAGSGALVRYLNTWMVFHDPPEHTRLRGLCNRFFAAPALDAMRSNIEIMAGELLDQMAGKARAGQPVDLIADFAYPLPAMVIMDLLGVPRAELERVKSWSDDIALFIGSAQATKDKYARAVDGTEAMAEYFHFLIEKRTKDPRHDLISALVAARDEGQALSADEVVGTCILLLFAGHETTTNLIGNGVLACLRFPDQWRRLGADPGLMDSAVEEFLRYDGPVGSVVRVAAADLEVRGTKIGKGERVFAALNAANRDRRQFDDPHRLDIGRTPNPHLIFGHGIHFCLGAPLARMEGRIAIAALRRRFPNMSLAADDLEWHDSLVLRGVKSLPVTAGP